VLFPLLAAGLLAAAPLGPPAPLPSSPSALSSAPHALRIDWARDGAITAVGAAVWLSSETFLKAPLAPDTCRWCDRGPGGEDTLNGLDRWARSIGVETEASRTRAARLSDVMAVVVMPASLFGLQYLHARPVGGTSLFAEDALIMLQSVTLALVTTQVVKFTVGRQRPFAHALPPGERPPPPDPADYNLSFFSGHTSLTFSLAVSAGVVSHLRGYEHPWRAWAVGLPMATGVALLRMAAEQHYLTDVMVGALIGSASGVAVPLLLHGRRSPVPSSTTLQLSPAPGRVALSGTF
jgi:membrane-associated phospholipid phosphatase